MALFDVLVVLTVIFVMLSFGAVANEQFVSHKYQLIKIKQTLIFIKTHIQDFYEESKFTGAYVKMYHKIYSAYK